METGQHLLPAEERVGAAASWFFQNAADLFAVLGPDGRFVSANRAWGAVTGWPAEALVGRSLRELIHPESLGDVTRMAEAVARDGFVDTRMRLACRAGGWVLLEGYARRGPHGEIMGVLRDVTAERARAEELDRVQRGRSRLQETAGVGLWEYDPETEQLEWSAEWQAMLAQVGVELRVADDFVAVCHPDDVENVIAAIDAVVANGGAGTLDHRFRAADGRWVWIKAHMWAETRSDGRRRVYGISQNVTALAEALSAGERARIEAEAQARRLSMALEAGRGSVIEVDFETCSVWTSPEFEKLTGRSMTFQEATAPVWHFVHPDDVPLVSAAKGRWQAGDAPPPIVARIVRPCGTSVWTRFYLRVDREGDRWLRFVGLLIDVDEPKRQELALIAAEQAAQAAAEAKAQFLANMSHEIRTPMNGVLGVLHLLKGQNLPAAATTMIDEALACGGMLQALLDDVVDFSKIEAGRLELAREPTSPTAIVASVAKMLRPQAEDKGVALHVEALDLPAWVTTDAVRLRQCLFNLVGNAVKFTARGSVTLRARSITDDRGVGLRFEVEDTGIGIAPTAQALLFQRFQQADTSTTRRFGGSGLGLAITREIVGLMGGTVGVSSRVGEGSIFWFEIAAPLSRPAEKAGVGGEAPLAGIRILVVEDNATNRMIATKMLEGLGAQVETAEDGEHGVQAVRSRPMDLILMDIQMPGIDGMEATRQIRDLAGDAAAVPIIALTANVLAHQRDTYLSAGMNGVVGKPISPVSLLAEISRICGGSEEIEPGDVKGWAAAAS